MDTTTLELPRRKLDITSADALPHVPNTLLAISFLCSAESSTYPSVIVENFEPPRFFRRRSFAAGGRRAMYFL